MEWPVEACEFLASSYEIYNHLDDHGELVDDIIKEYKNECAADSEVRKILASGGLRQKSGAEKVSRKRNQTIRPHKKYCSAAE